MRFRFTSVTNKVSAERNADSPLLCLYPELRNRIYRYVMGRKRFDMDHRKIYSHRVHSCLSTDGTAWVRPAIPLDGFQPMLLCRQTYMETCLLPFALNEFLVNYDIAPSATSGRLRPGQSNAIRAVHWNTFADTVSGNEIQGLCTFQGLVRLTILADPLRNGKDNDEVLRSKEIAIAERLKHSCSEGIRVHFVRRTESFPRIDLCLQPEISQG
jgi:hypothetical protein